MWVLAFEIAAAVFGEEEEEKSWKDSKLDVVFPPLVWMPFNICSFPGNYVEVLEYKTLLLKFESSFKTLFQVEAGYTQGSL